jgi:hypothetical protein
VNQYSVFLCLSYDVRFVNVAYTIRSSRCGGIFPSPSLSREPDENGGGGVAGSAPGEYGGGAGTSSGWGRVGGIFSSMMIIAATRSAKNVYKSAFKTCGMFVRRMSVGGGSKPVRKVRDVRCKLLRKARRCRSLDGFRSLAARG